MLIPSPLYLPYLTPNQPQRHSRQKEGERHDRRPDTHHVDPLRMADKRLPIFRRRIRLPGERHTVNGNSADGPDHYPDEHFVERPDNFLIAA